ncbi:isoprenylcysteine carboxylmethyltransferase family protein [Aliihoeflea aestuarii]|jgi:protein-S-isoprenylcysteine O-methyltransferase Ste14|uniref:methyltransferase family protein n=1 Tax=Aliihoeflea aestuarii TaxID=453840 RepID=UPI0020923BCC|nr:isoprenylcysteine carboxylmethyltransferase family protein [Aliihoeflea aestuarii]MCO6390287.1 isoprenylcysteine carboxylmethyltransferase family protein [Aliihoeflea aestuarii]
MTTTEKPPMRFPWPVAILLAFTTLAVIAGIFLPLPWFRGPFGEFLAGLGALAVLGGAALIIMVIAKFRSRRTPVAPYAAAMHLVTDGPFAISRNPIYLGMVTIMFAVALVFGNLWFVPFAIATAFAISLLAIRPEERHLEQRFGKAYRDYAKRVRRWI